MAAKIDSRNNQFDFMAAVGIVFVVFGHLYQPPYLFYPAFAFHMALFFFISGYFSKTASNFKTKFKYILRKTKTQAIPYFALNAFFGCITMLMGQKGIILGGEFTWWNMFISPFGRGDQFHLYLAAWFLLTLYAVNVTAIVLFSDKKWFDILISSISVLLLYYFTEHFTPPGGDSSLIFINFGIRVSIGFFFFSIGRMFRTFESVLQKYLLNPSTIVILFLIIDLLTVNFGNLTYNILFNDLGQSNGMLFVHIITTFCIILIIYLVGHIMSAFLTDNSLIYKIGRNTFSIMVWHLTMFLLVNIILYKLNLIQFSSLSNVYFKYKPEKTWTIYAAAGIFGPLAITKAYRYVCVSVLQLARAGCAGRKVTGN